jgi:hypothetical protein
MSCPECLAEAEIDRKNRGSDKKGLGLGQGNMSSNVHWRFKNSSQPRLPNANSREEFCAHVSQVQ